MKDRGEPGAVAKDPRKIEVPAHVRRAVTRMFDGPRREEVDLTDLGHRGSRQQIRKREAIHRRTGVWVE